MSNATFTFRVDDALKNQFTQAAQARDRSGAQLLRDFMRAFVQQQHDGSDHDDWFRSQVEVGLDSANAGNLVSDVEVEAKFAARRAVTRRQLDIAE